MLCGIHLVFAAEFFPTLSRELPQASPHRPAAALPTFTSLSSAAKASPPAEASSPRKNTEEGKTVTAKESSADADELSAIEKSVIAKAGAEDNTRPQPYEVQELRQFGYNFFRPAAAGFAPLADIPVGPDYVIGPGDRIILNLWGSAEGTHELEVNRSGEIVLPRVGSVKVWGITFERLPEVLKTHLSKIYKNFDLNVTMGKLRVIKVYVVGEVKMPGDYNLSPLSTLINALAASGGPLKTGTLRNIKIKRGGKVVETVDLYDFFLKGDKGKDIRLQPGDTIFVPVIGRVAGIAGNVKRPAIYELKDEKNLGDLVELAEGFLPTGYLQRVQITRVDAHDKRMVADFNIDPKGAGKSLDQIVQGIAIQDMDIVKIFPINATLRDHVRLDGYVLRPGVYALQPHMRLSQLLSQDNLLTEYYKDAAEITRLYPPDSHLEKIFVSVAKALAGDPEHDLELKEFDEVRIFSRWEMEEMPKVKVNGEVQRPGEYRLFANMTVRDLLMEAGNLKTSAYLKNAEINRISKTGESVSSFPIVINLEQALKGDPKDNLVLAPFDEVTIRKIPNWAEEKERYVTLRGEFRFPGVYPIHKGEKLSALIERAGGFTDKAYLRAAKYTREPLRELQQKRMDEMVAASEQEILKKQAELATTASSKEEVEATKAALESLQRSVALLKTAKAEGRLVIRLEQPDAFKGTASDVELMGGDTLEVPPQPHAVSVLGQVYNPTSFIPENNEDVAFYLEKAGGPTRNAEKCDIYIVRADGTVLSRQQSSFGINWSDSQRRWTFGGFMSTTLEPGDTVIVPQRFERIAWMREIKDIAVILGNLALAAGVIVAAGL
ncbi:periplasmic polysaccharide biosynthesis/export protein [Geobacter metallireducens GS-15]|uniref:Periplasmic polysaccharide biosynthesis/export protein n=1 Tax=Geobacter metallireducens (strain ATCC 53774 / DSM 7210 / GS-15) TaxID=269799 RepID=Q39TL2_GEOMG|nr:periplasmic polysaccharide biosynthesis/export protein [Geobacter metallireducens GS-15]